MCTFDAPISRCEAMHCMVITDQSQRQCATEHECPKGMQCPLDECFTGVEPPRAAASSGRRSPGAQQRHAA